MIRRLKLQFALICTGLTSLILVVTLWVIAGVYADRTHLYHQAAFANTADSITAKLLVDRSVSNSWLAGLEQSNQIVIYIEDNGNPLYFRGNWDPASDREQLIAAALETGPAPIAAVSRENSALDYSVRGDRGEEYRVRHAVSWLEGGKYIRSVVLQDLLREQTEIDGFRRTVFFSGAGALGLIALLSVILAKRSVRPLVLSQKAQNDFIAASSHELRTPFAIIASGVAALRTKEVDADTMIDAIEDECVHVGQLIDDLNTISRMQLPQLSMALVPIDLLDLLVAVTEEFELVAKEHGISLRLDLSQCRASQVLGDRIRLRQVFLILLDNAVKHSGTGLIEVEACSGKHEITVKIVDHGIGICQDDIFAPFRRGEGSHGFGLGLSIAREIVSLHRGTITCRETLGGGSTFVVTMKQAKHGQEHA